MKTRSVEEIEKALSNVRLNIAGDELRQVFVPVDCSNPRLYRDLCAERIARGKRAEAALVIELEAATGQVEMEFTSVEQAHC